MKKVLLGAGVVMLVVALLLTVMSNIIGYLQLCSDWGFVGNLFNQFMMNCSIMYGVAFLLGGLALVGITLIIVGAIKR